MLKKVGELKLDKQKDYYGKQVKALEASGFTLILEHEDFGNAYYSVAYEEKEGGENEID